MNMETAFNILSSVATFLVTLIVCTHLYSKIRPWFGINVTCWFCGDASRVAYDSRDGWDCRKCQQYNGFAADGGYNKLIPAQHDVRLNSLVAVSRPPTPATAAAVTGYQLCATCNANQQLKIGQLAAFVPTSAMRFDAESLDFSRYLDRIYALCAGCEATLALALAGQPKPPRSLIDSQEQRTSKTALVSFCTKAFRVISSALSSALLAAAILRLEPTPTSYLRLLPAEVADLAVATEVRWVCLAAGALAQALGSAGRWTRRDAAAVAAWGAAVAVHAARRYDEAEFPYWDVAEIVTLACCVAASWTAVRSARKTTILRRPIRSHFAKPADLSHASVPSGNAHQPIGIRVSKAADKLHASVPSGDAHRPIRIQPNQAKMPSPPEVSHLLYEAADVSVPKLPTSDLWKSNLSSSSLWKSSASTACLKDEGAELRGWGQDVLHRGIGNLNIGPLLPRRRLIEPSRLNVNVLHETDMFSAAASRSSSQSSGFASQCSQPDEPADFASPRANPFYRGGRVYPPSAALYGHSGAFSPRPASVCGRSPASDGRNPAFDGRNPAFVDLNRASPDFAGRGRDFRPRAASHCGDLDLRNWPKPPRSSAGDFCAAFSSADPYEPARSTGYPSPPSSRAGDDFFSARSRCGGSVRGGFVGCSAKSSSSDDASPNSTCSHRTAFCGSPANPNEMALVSCCRDDISTGSGGFGPVYLPPGLVVNHCCRHDGRLAAAMVGLGVLVNVVLFVCNSGLWDKVVEAMR